MLVFVLETRMLPHITKSISLYISLIETTNLSTFGNISLYPFDDLCNPLSSNTTIL